MIEFGLACNFGGAAFSYTMIPALAYLLNFGVMYRRPDQATDLKFQVENQRFRDGLIRDMSFFLLSCIAYFFIMSYGSISLMGALIQLFLFVLYIVSVWLMDNYHTSMIQSKLKEDTCNDKHVVISKTKEC